MDFVEHAAMHAYMFVCRLSLLWMVLDRVYKPWIVGLNN